ncbi:hypothetical protein [Anaerobiospirillum sp. NML120449]|uniref:hypothetical protein n=1 Tax=Anaerobiospirillum sp. NML120449 TaxID=2932817 RepID=UPI001FF1CD67|nr:hypothetical protein [Anaerobiospirillum sp. NML120449]MCK0527250.1 hypothetical protein [Anaerobiospirillum sp. NML120449]
MSLNDIQIPFQAAVTVVVACQGTISAFCIINERASFKSMVLYKSNIAANAATLASFFLLLLPAKETKTQKRCYELQTASVHE